MKILIIGSKGFIGSHVRAFLMTVGHEVWGCDVVNDYNSKSYFQVDATSADYHPILKNQKFKVCVNCSGAASVPLSLQNPLRDFMLNTVNVFKILDAIKVHQPECRFINLSSAAIYGNPEILPIVEEHLAKPVSPYGIHKLQAEVICDEFFRFYGIQSCNLRIFSAYGNGLKKQIFWDLYQKSMLASHVELLGTGNESRDFIHVTDVAQVINLVINHSNPYPILNVGNGSEVSIRDVVNTFYTFLDSGITYEFEGEKRDIMPSNWVADISKLKSMGYKQSVDLSYGLKQYVKWLKKDVK